MRAEVAVQHKDAFDDSLPTKLEKFGEVTSDENRLKDADVLLIRSKTKCTREFLEPLDKLKVIIRGGVGMDNIDRNACAEKGILALNTPKSSAIAVAELAFSLMLSVPNNLVFYDNTMKKGEWNKKTKRHELYGKRLALLGYGNIAREVSKRAQAFGMDVVAYDKYVKEGDVPLMDTMEDAVKDADYISMHLPLTDETRGVMGSLLISHMTKKPVVINTGRGGCVDEKAVREALDEGKLSWFATDVYSSEPPEAANPVLSSDKVTLTPHVGANSVENLNRIGDEVVATIEKLIEEKKI